MAAGPGPRGGKPIRSRPSSRGPFPAAPGRASGVADRRGGQVADSIGKTFYFTYKKGAVGSAGPPRGKETSKDHICHVSPSCPNKRANLKEQQEAGPIFLRERRPSPPPARIFLPADKPLSWLDHFKYN